MGGKKGDTKAAKKGGGKESSAPAKPDPKAKNEKKGGKGKEKEDKKKGKDVKKAKKEITSEEEEEVSDAELIKEQSEESKNEEEDEEAEVEIQTVVRGGRGREKGVAALKGASKAMAGMNKGKGKRGQVEVPLEDTKAKGLKKDLARAQLKGATKAMAGLVKKPAPPAKKKRSLKATSKLFMKFRQLKPKRSKKGHFKTASKLFMGLRNKFAASSLLDKKKKSAAMLKNTSKLMLGLKRGTEKPLPKPSSGAKPSFLLIRLGGNAPKPEPQDKKGPGKLFGGLFGRKKAKEKFKPRAKVLTKVSSAASWLTKRFLSKKSRNIHNERAIQDAWLTRMGAQKLPFPSQEELNRHRTNMSRFPGAHRFYGQYEDVYGHPKNFEAYRHQRFPTERYLQNGPGRYDDPSMEYYDYHDEDYAFDPYGYPNEEDEFPFGHNGQFPSYAGEDEEYGDYSGYPMEEDYTAYHENMEYYDEASHLLKSQNSYFEYEVDVHNPPNAYSSYELEDNEMGYSEDPMNPYDPRENENESFGYFSAQVPYSDMEETEDYNNFPVPMNTSGYSVSPYAEPFNPYAQPLDDIMEHDDPETMLEHGNHPYYESQELEENSSTLSRNRKYKLFPRPQVKLFGHERLDVPLPPSPHISFTDFDEEEEDYEDEPLLPPQQQRNQRQQTTKSLFAKSIQRNFVQPHARGVQKLLSAKPVGKIINTPHHQDHYQEMDSQDFSPRAFGSPLGQFMKKSLSPKPILKRNDSHLQRRPISPPPRNLFMESTFARTQSPQLSIKHFQIPNPSNDYHTDHKPSAQQLEALQKDLADERSSTMPYHKRFGHKLTGMESSKFLRKTSNNNNTETNSSLQLSNQRFPSSPHAVPRFNNQGKDIPMPPSPNLSTRQRPLSPKPAMNAFGLNKSNAVTQSQHGHYQNELRSSLRQRDHLPSPQLAKANFPRSPSPTRMTHWSSNSSNLNTSSVGPSSNTSVTPSSPLPSMKRGNSFRNAQDGALTPQPSMSSRGGSATLQMQGPRPRNYIPAQSNTVSPAACPLSQRIGNIAKKEFQMPPSPQPARRGFKGSNYYSENQVTHQKSPQMSRRIDEKINDQQENDTHGWGKEDESSGKAVKPLMMNPFMKHLRRTGEMKPLNASSPRGSMAEMPPYRHSNPSHQMSQRQQNRYGMASSPTEQQKSPILRRNDSMRGSSRLCPPSLGSNTLHSQGSENSMARGSHEGFSQSLPFSDPPRSPMMGRHDSIRGPSPPSPASQRQESGYYTPREFYEASEQSLSFPDPPRSPVMGRHNSIKRTLNWSPPNPGSQLLNRQGSNRLMNRDVNEASMLPTSGPAPNSKNPFWQRIGQPLVGMSQGPPPSRQLLRREEPPVANRVPEKVAGLFVKKFGQMAGSQMQRPKSPSFSVKEDLGARTHKPPTPQHFRHPHDDWRPIPSQTQQRTPTSYSGNVGHPRSPSPQPGLKSLGGFMSESLNQANHGSPKGRSSIHLKFQGSPTLAGANHSLPRYPHPRVPYMGHGPPKSQAEYYDGDFEDFMGRYAVVMPQVQRMETFRGRGSLRKQPWPRHHAGNVHEMPGTWSSNKSMHMPWTETLRRGSRRAKEKVASYLAHGSGRSHRNWQQVIGTGNRSQWNNKMQPMRSPQNTGPGQEQDENGAQDMTQLEDLQEASVLNNLRKRFDRELIYTYIGSILLSLNPYKMLNIYGTDHVLLYEGRALGENPPHLFAIANVAYTKLMDAKHNQCIIISGESGSGKTEATKLVLRYLVAVNQRRGVTNQILEATPLLESFGNAKTVRNDNSSRFGKFVEIYLEEGVICGAITSQYLLEKSRIVFQAKNERNYHIFYEMLAGLPSQQKQIFYLQDAETYYYLNQGGNCEIPSKSDAEDFRRLLNAMESLSFNIEDQDSIFRVLSSILHLGNVYFEKYETESQEVASVVSASEIRVVSELLQISHEGLQKAITYKVTETMREKIFTPLTVDSAVDARDAIAKILYSLLFTWLTDRINKLVYPKQDALSIAILDIYGFEDLNFNSFEQLCINYANEYLQFFYNKIVFKEEQEEYIREQIDWREISFTDNQSCIDLISQKPYGILRILDDQCCFPQATDHTFLQKCHYHHGTSELYCKPKMPLPEFGIKHFAGKVTYQVHKFLDKNYDQVRQDVLDLFVNSKIKVVANLFFSHAQVLSQQKTMMGKSSTVTRKYKAQTVAAKFQQSLLELVEKMERCNPFFVRCIKPNSKKEPSMFEPEVVVSQLKYSGILETIRIRKEGYPVRIPFHIFLSRYRCVMDLGRNIHVDGQICITVLRKLCPSVNPAMYCIGASKLFLKENLYQQLESKRDQLMNKAAVTLQRYSRGFLTRRRFKTLRYRIIQLQALARGYLARQKFHNWRKSMIKFRALVHMYVNRRRYLRVAKGAVCSIQWDEQPDLIMCVTKLNDNPVYTMGII